MRTVLAALALVVALALPVQAETLGVDAAFLGGFAVELVADAGRTSWSWSYFGSGGGAPLGASYLGFGARLEPREATSGCFDMRVPASLWWSVTPQIRDNLVLYALDDGAVLCLDAMREPGALWVSAEGSATAYHGRGPWTGARGTVTWTFDGRVSSPSGGIHDVLIQWAGVAGSQGAFRMQGELHLP